MGAVKRTQPDFPVLARTVVQKRNCADLSEAVRHAQSMGVDGISFSAADVSSTAFNRPDPWTKTKIRQVALSRQDLPLLARSLEDLLDECRHQFHSGFIRTSPAKLWNLYRYYKALLGEAQFPQVQCNAPWISSVVE